MDGRHDRLAFDSDQSLSQRHFIFAENHFILAITHTVLDTSLCIACVSPVLSLRIKVDSYSYSVYVNSLPIERFVGVKLVDSA